MPTNQYKRLRIGLKYDRSAAFSHPYSSYEPTSARKNSLLCTMFSTRAAAPLLLAAATALLVSPAQAATCETPSVRREWRTFSTYEKADWIAAVNCLSNLPHDDALTPSVDPSISNIVPVNASGSYYDGSYMFFLFTLIVVTCTAANALSFLL